MKKLIFIICVSFSSCANMDNNSPAALPISGNFKAVYLGMINSRINTGAIQVYDVTIDSVHFIVTASGNGVAITKK